MCARPAPCAVVAASGHICRLAVGGYRSIGRGGLYAVWQWGPMCGASVRASVCVLHALYAVARRTQAHMLCMYHAQALAQHSPCLLPRSAISAWAGALWPYMAAVLVRTHVPYMVVLRPYIPHSPALLRPVYRVLVGYGRPCSAALALLRSWLPAWPLPPLRAVGMPPPKYH